MELYDVWAGSTYRHQAILKSKGHAINYLHRRWFGYHAYHCNMRWGLVHIQWIKLPTRRWQRWGCEWSSEGHRRRHGSDSSERLGIEPPSQTRRGLSGGLKYIMVGTYHNAFLPHEIELPETARAYQGSLIFSTSSHPELRYDREEAKTQ